MRPATPSRLVSVVRANPLGVLFLSESSRCHP
ncbi:Uncharacterised protein [Vibrio cholerae]|nr:Uncharacterised protein [Vibrio cholerae]